MPYLIDGHNLIPVIGLSLSDPHDEAKLVSLLTRYFARTRRTGTVYFDRRAPGAPQGSSTRHLRVHFVASPRTADDEIRSHLSRLRGDAHNWVVVSSDQMVRNAARRAGARWLSAPAFAAELGTALAAHGTEKPEPSCSADELARLEQMFLDRDKPERPG